jgi:hypothetical protein
MPEPYGDCRYMTLDEVKELNEALDEEPHWTDADTVLWNSRWTLVRPATLHGREEEPCSE